MRFPVSGVRVSPLVPVLVALAVSTVTSMGGIAGAVVLLPFQVSVLGFVSPAVTATNHFYNVVAVPLGVYRYLREGRMVWPLTAVILLGSIPGAILGALARLRYLPDPRQFQVFMGLTLLLVGARLAQKALGRAARGAAPLGPFRVRLLRVGLSRLEYEFAGQVHRPSTPALLLLTLIVGMIGGAYGVGGGALIAPFLVSAFGLPVHSIAGATLAGTWTTSLASVGFFSVAGPLLGLGGSTPDWLLGGLFGLGGLPGMYFGARLQRRVPARVIEGILAVGVVAMALGYLGVSALALLRGSA